MFVWRSRKASIVVGLGVSLGGLTVGLRTRVTSVAAGCIDGQWELGGLRLCWFRQSCSCSGDGLVGDEGFRGRQADQTSLVVSPLVVRVGKDADEEDKDDDLDPDSASSGLRVHFEEVYPSNSVVTFMRIGESVGGKEHKQKSV